MAVVLGVDDIDSEFTHVEFDILIASDALDADFASRDTDIEIEAFRDVDRNGVLGELLFLRARGHVITFHALSCLNSRLSASNWMLLILRLLAGDDILVSHSVISSSFSST
jgi:hypothetical protein